MSSISDQLFGALPKEYCMYFYYLSVFGFIFMAITLVTALSLMFSKPQGKKFAVGAVMAVLGYAVFYFQNRLLYSMCVHSL